MSKNDIPKKKKEEKKKLTNSLLNEEKSKILKVVEPKSEIEILMEKTFEFFKNLQKRFITFFEKEDEKEYISEYYELEKTYNETIINVIPQTPTKLFVYWDIDNNTKLKLEEEFGKDYINTTNPYLVVKNTNTNEVFEVKINDMTNSWYIDIKEEASSYIVSYIRRGISKEKEENSSKTEDKIITKNTEDDLKNEVLNKDLELKSFKKLSLNINPINNTIINDKKDKIVEFKISSSNTVNTSNNKMLNFEENIVFEDINTNEKIVENIENFKFAKEVIYNYINKYVDEHSKIENEKMSS